MSFELFSLQDIRQTKEYTHFMEKIGWQVETINHSTIQPFNNNSINVFIKKLPLLPFSVIKILRYKPPLQLNKLQEICKKHHPILVKLEPFEIEKIEGSQIYFKVLESNKSPLIPTKTLWIDLSKSEKQLLSEMKPKTRYNLRKALKTPPRWPHPSNGAGTFDVPNGLLGGGRQKKETINSRNLKFIYTKVIPGNKITKKQLQSFHHLWSQGKPYNWLFKPQFNELKWLVESFGSKCFFVFTHKFFSPCHSELDSESIAVNYLYRFLVGARNDKGNRLLASCLILTSKNMAFYWHNASTKLGKKLFAPTLAIWEAIKESKRRNLKIFDFEGVWDERFPGLNKGWEGFSRFKKGFRA